MGGRRVKQSDKDKLLAEFELLTYGFLRVFGYDAVKILWRVVNRFIVESTSQNHDPLH